MRHTDWYIFYFSPVVRHLIVLIPPFSCLLLVQRAKIIMPSDIWVTQNVNLSICHQWCATWSVLFSHFPCLLMVQRGKTNVSDVYYLCPVMYEAHRMVTYPFVTSGAPLDWCYSPVYSVYSWPDGQNKYKKIKIKFRNRIILTSGATWNM